eukprot:935953-Alexandrium_andersonii.AAC.1
MQSWFPAVPQPMPGTVLDVWRRLRCRPAAPHDRRDPGRAGPRRLSLPGAGAMSMRRDATAAGRWPSDAHARAPPQPATHSARSRVGSARRCLPAPGWPWRGRGIGRRASARCHQKGCISVAVPTAAPRRPGEPPPVEEPRPEWEVAAPPVSHEALSCAA